MDSPVVSDEDVHEVREAGHSVKGKHFMLPIASKQEVCDNWA